MEGMNLPELPQRGFENVLNGSKMLNTYCLSVVRGRRTPLVKLVGRMAEPHWLQGCRGGVEYMLAWMKEVEIGMRYRY